MGRRKQAELPSKAEAPGERPGSVDASDDALGEPFVVRIPVRIRRCREKDLPKLEWFGRYTHDREIIHDAFRRQEAGENVMLVADARGAPIGQVWIDLTRRSDHDAGYIWALRVFPWMRGFGIGRRLLAAAEDLIRREAFAWAELDVDKENERARRLYERLGYSICGTAGELDGDTTPHGTPGHVPQHQWTLRKDLAA